MRAAFALLLIVAAGALGWWLLGRPAGTPPIEGVGDPAAPEERAPEPAETSGTSTPSLPVRAPPKGPTVAPSRKATGSTVSGTGDLVVALVAPDGTPVPADVKIDLEPIGWNVSSYPLPLRREDGTWKYTAIPAGRYRVWVLSGAFRDASVETTMTPDEETRASVTLVRGASAKFRVANWAGEAPPPFTLSVLDGRKLPVSASFQTSATRVRVPAGKAMGGVPEGTVIGLKPGTYTLRATSEEGETDETTFEARVGEEPPTLELKLKR